MSGLTEFRALLTRKKALLEKIREVTREQPRLIAADETDALLDNVAQRQHLLDELDSIQGELPSASAMRADPACEQLAREVNALLKEIQAHDAENEKMALRRMEEIKTELKNTRRGKTGVAGYGGAPRENEAIYFDKQH